MDLQKGVKYGAVGLGIFDIIRSISFVIVFGIIFIVLFAMGVPWYITFPFLIFLIVFIFLQIKRLIRIAKA
jgi:hypothetical protein